MVRRFVDFDIKLRRKDFSAADFDTELRRLKAEAHDFLRQAYPAIGALRCDDHSEDWGYWYVQDEALSIAGTGNPSALAIEAMSLAHQVDAAYWDLHSALRNSPFDSNLAVDELVRLADHRVKLNASTTANQEFASYPVRWPERFRSREVNDIVRISQLDFTSKQLTLNRGTYLDSCVTNVHSDEPLESLGGRTMRQLSTQDGGVAPFRLSPLANGLGVACLFLDNRNTVVFNDRRESDAQEEPMAIMKAGMHASSSGVLEWKDVCRADGSVDVQSFAHGIVRGMVREIHRECAVPATGVDGITYEIASLEFARELPRAGKPQVFFVARFNCHSSDLIELVRRRRKSVHLAPEGHEYGDYFSQIGLRRGRARPLKQVEIVQMTYECYGAYRALTRATRLDRFLWRPASDFGSCLTAAI